MKFKLRKCLQCQVYCPHKHTSQRTPHNAHLTTHTSQHTPHNTPHNAHLTTHTSQRTPHNAHLTTHTSQHTPHNTHLTTHTSQPTLYFYYLKRQQNCLFYIIFYKWIPIHYETIKNSIIISIMKVCPQLFPYP